MWRRSVSTAMPSGMPVRPDTRTLTSDPSAAAETTRPPRRSRKNSRVFGDAPDTRPVRAAMLATDSASAIVTTLPRDLEGSGMATSLLDCPDDVSGDVANAGVGDLVGQVLRHDRRRQLPTPNFQLSRRAARTARVQGATAELSATTSTQLSRSTPLGVGSWRLGVLPSVQVNRRSCESARA